MRVLKSTFPSTSTIGRLLVPSGLTLVMLKVKASVTLISAHYSLLLINASGFDSSRHFTLANLLANPRPSLRTNLASLAAKGISVCYTPQRPEKVPSFSFFLVYERKKNELIGGDK